MAEIIESIDRRSAQHYSWGNSCDGWHLVKTEALSIIEERMPPGTSEIRHYHQKSNQFLYVLEGNLQIDVEGNDISLNAGQGLHIEAGKQVNAIKSLTGPRAMSNSSWSQIRQATAIA